MLELSRAQFERQRLGDHGERTTFGVDTHTNSIYMHIVCFRNWRASQAIAIGTADRRSEARGWITSQGSIAAEGIKPNRGVRFFTEPERQAARFPEGLC
jgi:hypothetical protein